MGEQDNKHKRGNDLFIDFHDKFNKFKIGVDSEESDVDGGGNTDEQNESSKPFNFDEQFSFLDRRLLSPSSPVLNPETKFNSQITSLYQSHMNSNNQSLVSVPRRPVNIQNKCSVVKPIFCEDQHQIRIRIDQYEPQSLQITSPEFENVD